MIADPFKVLGVSESATDAELKKAYRDLSKKWHPDQHPEDPKGAEERFKEIQEAYRQIVDAREHGTSPYGRSYGSGTGSSGSAYGGTYSSPFGYGYQRSNQSGRTTYAEYGGGGSAWFEDYFRDWQRYSETQRRENARREQADSNEIQAARNYIQNGYYREAMNALNQVSPDQRNARWYYFAAVASQGLGSNVTALEYAKRASDMEPDNLQYQSLLQQLSGSGQWYQRQNQNYGFSTFGGGSTERYCMSLCLMNMLCSMCGGGGVFCL